MTHTGTPRAPARWARDVSGVITRSRSLDQRGGVHEVVKQAAEIDHGKTAPKLLELLGARPF